MPASGGCSNNRSHRLSSGKVGREIGDDEVGHGPAGLDRRTPPMRLEHDIVHAPKRFRNVRLVRKYVQACPAQTPLRERGNQRGLDDALDASYAFGSPPLQRRSDVYRRVGIVALLDDAVLAVQRAVPVARPARRRKARVILAARSCALVG